MARLATRTRGDRPRRSLKRLIERAIAPCFSVNRGIPELHNARSVLSVPVSSSPTFVHPLLLLRDSAIPPLLLFLCDAYPLCLLD